MVEEVTKPQQVADQYLVVAALAENIALVHRQIEPMIRQGTHADLNEMRGTFSAERMELLGDILNGMDAVDEADAWMAPIFERAHAMFPTDAWDTKALTTAQAEIEARDALLRECLRWLPLLESHEAGSTTDLLCDRIRATLGEQP